MHPKKMYVSSPSKQRQVMVVDSYVVAKAAGIMLNLQKILPSLLHSEMPYTLSSEAI